MDDCRLKANMVGKSRRCCSSHIDWKLGHEKAAARWVPRLFSIEQKQRRADVPIECLEMFRRPSFGPIHSHGWNTSSSFHTLDERIVETMVWKERIGSEKCEDNPICWQGYGVSFFCVGQFSLIIFKKDWQSTAFVWWNQYKMSAFGEKEGVISSWHAQGHTFAIAVTKINDLKYELLPRAPYSPDSSPSDFYLFLNLKKCL